MVQFFRWVRRTAAPDRRRGYGAPGWRSWAALLVPLGGSPQLEAQKHVAQLNAVAVMEFDRLRHGTLVDLGFSAARHC